MSEFVQTPKGLANVCGKSEYQVVQLSGLDPALIRRLFDGEKLASKLTIIRRAIALVMDPKLAQGHSARVLAARRAGPPRRGGLSGASPGYPHLRLQ